MGIPAATGRGTPHTGAMCVHFRAPEILRNDGARRLLLSALTQQGWAACLHFCAPRRVRQRGNGGMGEGAVASSETKKQS